MGILDKVKENIHAGAVAARDGVEELQVNHELGQAYRELGRRTFDLVEGGSLASADLDDDMKRIRELRSDLGKAATAAK
jgi:hypothetical protein